MKFSSFFKGSVCIVALVILLPVIGVAQRGSPCPPGTGITDRDTPCCGSERDTSRAAESSLLVVFNGNRLNNINEERIHSGKPPLQWSASTLRCPCDTTLALFDQTQWTPEERDAVAEAQQGKGEGPPFFKIGSLQLGSQFYDQGRTTLDSPPEGAAIKVAILDSGLDTGIKKEHRHEVAETMNMSDFSEDVSDASGHGTAVFAVIDGHVKNLAQYYIYKCIDDELGYATTFSIACALKCALAADVDVINMSFGSYTNNKLLRKIIEKELTTQIIITSQGNDCCTDPHYPSDYKYTYGIVGLDADWITPSQPNASLWSCTNGYGRRGNLLAAPCTIRGTDSSFVQGTSFAAAFTTGRFVNYLFGNLDQTPFRAFKRYLRDPDFVARAPKMKYLPAVQNCVTINVIK